MLPHLRSARLCAAVTVRDVNSNNLPPLLARIREHADRTAVHGGGAAHTYGQLSRAAERMAGALLEGRPDLEEARVAFLIPPGFDFAATLLGIWQAGGVAVPLALSHPAPELEHVIRDSGASILLAAPDDQARLEPIARATSARFAVAPVQSSAVPFTTPQITASRRALILYTSGTTGKPKGVVSTHGNVEARITALVLAWEWGAHDRIPLVLPLHHVHGLINVVCCALWSGAQVEMPASFDARTTWQRLASGDITLFMAVPTVYHRLIAAWEQASADERRTWSSGARGLRLFVSGSAALPVSTLQRWRETTGHTLLERYGMTEIGMALSNPLHGERRPGTVGVPLPGVDVQLVDEAGTRVPSGTAGEIEVRGAAVFREYWQRPEETEAAFRGGWFRTGDVAIVEDGYYRILGRSSTDIIKTGGYKVSALEIEEIVRQHPSVADCAVVGCADPEWGERIAAAVELLPAATLTLAELQDWTRVRLAPYKVPRALECVAALPRNALGKVLKPEVRRMFA